MRFPWFREYSDDLLRPPVAKLSPSDFKAWSQMKAIANQEVERGLLPTVADLAYRLHQTEGTVGNVLGRLHNLGLVSKDEVSGRFQVVKRPNNDHFPKSDSSRDRTRDWREKKRHGDGHSDGDVTGGDGHSDGLEEEEIAPFGRSERERYESSDLQSSDSRSEAEEEGDEIARARRHLRSAGIAGGHSDGFVAMVQESGLECVKHCIDEAVRHNKLSLAYVDSIRQRHLVEECDEVGSTRLERTVARLSDARRRA